MPDKKDLNEVVIDALELHSSYELPELNLGHPKQRLVVGSGNALPTGRIIFNDEDALFADEGQYKTVLDLNPSVGGAVVISASGEKDAPFIIKYLRDRDLETFLLTCNRNSSAGRLLAELSSPEYVIETKSNEEPITYNTSTYLGMILAKTRENPRNISNHIKQHVDPTIPINLGGYRSFYIILQPEYDIVREMFLTKFDELFGGKINGRCYTSEQTRHAKTIIPSEDEMFISIGFRNGLFGDPEARWDIPLFDGATFGSVIALGYYAIGRVQERNPPYFKKRSDTYPSYQKNELFNDSLIKKIFNISKNSVKELLKNCETVAMSAAKKKRKRAQAVDLKVLENVV